MKFWGTSRRSEDRGQTTGADLDSGDAANRSTAGARTDFPFSAFVGLAPTVWEPSYEGDPSSGGCAKHVVSPLETRTPIVARSFVDTYFQPDICM